MKEIRIGGLLVQGTTPEFNLVVAAAEAIAAAQTVIDQASVAGAEIHRVRGPVAQLLAPVVHAANPLDAETRDTAVRVKTRRRVR